MVDETEDSIDLGSLLRTIWRGKWIIVAVMAICIAIGGYYAFVVAVPVYRSASVVMLETRQEQVVDLTSVLGGLNGSDAEINSEAEILRSRTLIGNVVDELDLVADPEFNTSLQPVSLLQSAKSSLRGLLGGGDDDVTRNPEEEAAWIRNRTINTLLDHLSIRNLPQTLVFQVQVVSENPRKAAQIADTIADQYIRNQMDVKYEATEQATSWLSSRVSDLQGELEAAEARVRDFSARTDLIDNETLQALERQLKDVRDRIAGARSTLEKAQAQYAALLDAGTRAEQAKVANDQQLNRYLAQADGDGTMAEAFDNRFQQILTRAEVEVTRSRNQLVALENSRDTLAQQIETQSNDLITLQQLQREAEASRLLYEYFLTRLKETSAQQGIQQADSRLLSYAVIPETAIAPRKSLILVASAFVGFLLGVALVLIREMRADTFRSAGELERATASTVMGQIPMLPTRHRRDVPSYLADRPASAAAEAVRNLRTSIMLSNMEHPPQIIGTTSSVPGEGKTTVSLALAQNFVGLGKKVLLIEGDIRRRVFSQYMEIGDGQQGLVAVLAGKAKIGEVVLQDDRIGADVLIAEGTSTNAADLFSSERFAALLSSLRDEYDYIIIDTPPVLIVPDARIIAQQVDAMMFVVAWDRTQKPQVMEALHLFESVNREVTGIVLNQISAKGMKRYGYGGKYGSYASYGQKYYVD